MREREITREVFQLTMCGKGKLQFPYSILKHFIVYVSAPVFNTSCKLMEIEKLKENNVILPINSNVVHKYYYNIYESICTLKILKLKEKLMKT
jgi:hypothetical protein